DPHDDGRLPGVARCPHVEEEAVFTDIGDSIVVDAPGRPWRLDTAGTEPAGIAQAFPALCRDGCRPPSVANWWLPVGNSFERAHALRVHSARQGALADGDDGPLRSRGHGPAAQ